ncbi:DUF294 nucleotidyltransferase-like domain-containing protein [Azohydromonas sp.]|uniref:DUF294 nucleotidyltransferase-like domain-containing protein n=1 Tax=Azohydromonas sp. TaxID=1872666 RepID=UPI002B877624|nr:DUF294 nucleotidyltransferase-like domain-containing protein [Azohydromonas sp.]HMM85052.1 DUF294 nucleotidyltransferase-like domain-containing protein [Azohydromonas sp.]
MDDTAASPAPGAIVAALRRHPPFARMTADDVTRFAAAAQAVSYRAGQTVVAPADGPVAHLWWLQRGHIAGRRRADMVRAGDAGQFQIDAGELFPVGAALGGRAVTSTYVAEVDCDCLRVPLDAVQALAAASTPLAEFLHARVLHYLDVSRQMLQATLSSQTLAEQSLETPLGRLVRQPPVHVAPGSAVVEALRAMHERRIGSVLVAGDDGAPLGILTRHDVLGRITLPQRPLTTPIAEVMSAPVHTLDVAHTAQDAALLMSRHGVRHVPVTERGRLVGIVSERDLFAMQRLSVKQLGSAIRGAADVDAMRAATRELRQFAQRLLAQGVGARQITELISHFNDLVTERLVHLAATRRGLDLQRACWLAFGSEGRSEQTIATDQDNGLIFASDDPGRDRPAWLAFAREVNEALDACGYPLCKGGVMASNPACCLTADEWAARFDHWIGHGSPTDLLNASIYFDFRALAGRLDLAAPLRERVVADAARTPRFMKQMAENALRNSVPLNWLGAIRTEDRDGRQWLDLKLHGTMLFVDAARLFALARGIAETGTRARFEAVGRALQVAPQESESWAGAFEVLQMLRLRVQIEPGGDAANPNRIDFARLGDIDRRVLKEVYRIARRLQQRMELDYHR